MEVNFPRDLEDHVTCPICLGQYQDPRILPCLHTYCKGCLEELLDKGDKGGTRSSIECPECREAAQVEDVSSLRVNIWVNRGLSLLEVFKAEKNQDGKPQLVCNNCDSNEPAKARCFDCERFVCDFCTKAHARMTILKGHQIKPLEELHESDIPVMEKLMLCSKHKGKKQKLFCEDCDVLICKDCTLIDHKDHNFSFVTDAVVKHKESLQNEINSLNKIEKKIESALNTVKDMKERAKKNSEDIEQEIDTVINAKIQTLEERRTVLKQELRNTTALKFKRLSAQEDGLLMHSAALKSATNFTENLLNNGSASEILSMAKQLLARMSEQSQKDIDEEVDSEDQVELQVNHEAPLLSPGFLKLVDDGVPDPKRCSLSNEMDKHGNETMVLQVRNCKGNIITVKKSRIMIKCSYKAEVLEKGSWFICEGFSGRVLKCVPKITIRGKFRLVQTEGCDLEVIIDGQPIEGTPFKVST